MDLFRRFISSELRHYRKLSKEGQQLLLSFFLFNLANPILWSFATAFVWRETHDMSIVALFNFAIFVGLPVGYYFNGKLLKKYPSNILYFYGCIAQGVAIVLLMYSSSPLLYMLLGLLFGLTSAFFWANKAFLTMKATKSSQRVYFSGLDQIFGIISGIIVPVFVGWFIIFGSHSHLYHAKTAYQLLSIGTLGVLYFAANIVKHVHTEKVPVRHVTFVKSCKQWVKIRIAIFILGLSSGIETVLPTLMVLTLVGKEDSLGEIQSLSGVFLAIAVYQIVKKINKDARIYIFSIGIFMSLAAAFLFGFYFSFFGVLCYFILNAIGAAFKWSTVTPINFDMIDFEEKYHSRHKYASIFDQQLFLNLGRNASLAAFLLFIPSGAHDALRFTPLLFAMPQVLLLWLITSVETRMMRNDIRERSLVFNYMRSKFIE